MKVTYIRHSGFFVELEKSWFLFDYYRGQIPTLPKGKDGYVFVSHRHVDHFNKEIFKLTEKQKDIRFILSDDIWEKRIPEISSVYRGSSGMEDRCGIYST